jgi:hypothetical protein
LASTNSSPSHVPLAAAAEHWQEASTPFRKTLVLHGETYHVESLFDTQPMQHDVAFVAHDDPRARFSPSRRFCYLRRTLPAGFRLPIAAADKRGHVSWTTDVAIPVLAAAEPKDNQVVDLNLYTWMSLTPMEFITLREGISLATGDVMIGGLGLGWFLARVCAKESVGLVRIVELQQELIDWLRPAIELAYPAVLTKQVEWLAGSAWDHIDCFGPETRNLIDIWPDYGGAIANPMVQEVRRTRAPKYFWCWGEDAWGPVGAALESTTRASVVEPNRGGRMVYDSGPVVLPRKPGSLG